MLQDPHSSGPAPGYSIESDSEDDLWDDVSNPLQASSARGSTNGSSGTREVLSWSDGDVESEAHAVSALWVLIGEAGAYISSGLERGLEAVSSPVYLCSTSNPSRSPPVKRAALVVPPPSAPKSHAYAVLPSATPLELQTAIAQAVLARTSPKICRIVTSYSATGYVPRPRGQLPVRWLATAGDSAAVGQLGKLATRSLALEVWDVPNLVKGVEAAITIESSNRLSPCTILLLPSQAPSSLLPSSSLAGSAPGDGLYDHSPSSSDPFPTLLPPDPRSSLGEVLDALELPSGWTAARAHTGSGWRLLEGLGQRSKATVLEEGDGGSMYL